MEEDEEMESEMSDSEDLNSADDSDADIQAFKAKMGKGQAKASNIPTQESDSDDDSQLEEEESFDEENGEEEQDMENGEEEEYEEDDGDDESGDDGDVRSIDDEEEGKVQNMPRSSHDNDIRKGKSIQNQLSIWDHLLECRIKMHKGINLSNQLPQGPSHFKRFAKTATGENHFTTAVQGAQTAVKSVLDSCLELQVIKSNQINYHAH